MGNSKNQDEQRCKGVCMNFLVGLCLFLVLGIATFWIGIAVQISNGCGAIICILGIVMVFYCVCASLSMWIHNVILKRDHDEKSTNRITLTVIGGIGLVLLIGNCGNHIYHFVSPCISKIIILAIGLWGLVMLYKWTIVMSITTLLLLLSVGKVADKLENGFLGVVAKIGLVLLLLLLLCFVGVSTILMLYLQPGLGP